MGKKRKRKFKKGFEKKKRFNLPIEIKQMILGIVMILFAVIIGLSFFNSSNSYLRGVSLFKQQ